MIIDTILKLLQSIRKFYSNIIIYFLRLTAAVFLAKKVKVYFYNSLVHTPLVPFGVKTLGAVCGVMITASHNPKQDNGYKVYWENACQIIPPHDAGIASDILENLEPWGESCWDLEAFRICDDPFEEILAKYLNAIGKCCKRRLIKFYLKYIGDKMRSQQHLNFAILQCTELVTLLR
jgi:phosphomannomutase